MSVMSERPDVVFVLGGPGAGKGTQCQFIVKVGHSALLGFKTTLCTHYCRIFATLFSAIFFTLTACSNLSARIC